MSNVGVEDERNQPVFIHSELDDLGLDPYAFRVYARLARRVSGKQRRAYESVAEMAKGCRMSPRKVRDALRELETMRLVIREERKGETSVYRLTDHRAWKTSTPAPHAAPTPARDATPPRHDVPPTPAPHAEDPGTTCRQRYSTEGNPLKEEKPRAREATELAEVPSPTGDTLSTRPHAKNAPKAPSRNNTDAQRVVDAYNEHRGPLPAAQVLNRARETKIRALIRDLGSVDEAVAVMGIAAAEVATSEFYRENGYGLDTLLAGQKVIGKAEAAVNRGTTDRTKADRDRLLAAIGGT